MVGKKLESICSDPDPSIISSCKPQAVVVLHARLWIAQMALRLALARVCVSSQLVAPSGVDFLHLVRPQSAFPPSSFS